MKTTILASAILLNAYLTCASPFRRDEPQYQIQWGPCPDGSPSGLDCGQLEVPINWTDPDGDKTTIGMNRLNATNPANRIGSLIFNPGGPGEVATVICTLHAAGVPAFSDALTQNFDIVCPDPRGVGTSTPVMCDPEVWNWRVSQFPENQAEFEQLVAANKAKGENCHNLTGPLLANLDTISVAKDFEATRIALDDGPLNYFGLSYGSLIGTTYAQLFPENFRVIAIDGILDHSQDRTSSLYIESTSYENVLDRFFQWCATNVTACGLVGDDLPQMFDDLIVSANQSPVPAPGCLSSADASSAGTCRANVTGDDIRLSAQSYLGFKAPLLAGYTRSWGGLGLALNQSITNNNATLFSNALAQSQADPLYPTVAIACLDFDRIDISNMTQAFAEFQGIQTAGNAFNQHVGPAAQAFEIQSSCVGWPISPVYLQSPLNQTALSDVPTILTVNAVHDSATSYVWASSVKEQIKNSVLLTRQGDGHTSYYLQGEASMLMDAYLVNRTLPEPGMVVLS